MIRHVAYHLTNENKVSFKLNLFSPTPTVEWNRLGASMSDRAYTESFGMELVIDDVQFEDAGIYECSGINKHSTTPIRHSVQLTVQGKNVKLLLKQRSAF